jgi:spore cortex formation protein SpoVR/YcgB (stage V sporulation)
MVGSTTGAIICGDPSSSIGRKTRYRHWSWINRLWVKKSLCFVQGQDVEAYLYSVRVINACSAHRTAARQAIRSAMAIANLND